MATAAEQKASRHLSQIRFHQQFILSANPDLGRPNAIRVTYALADYRNHGLKGEPGVANHEFEGGPTVLIIGGMYGTRYMCAGNIGAMARKHRARVLCADKFGLGGTDDIPLKWRVKSYIDLIEALLIHLDIKHVTVASHSAGTIYNINLVLRLRHILHPKNPFICLLSPFVHPSRSGELKLLNVLPDALLGQSNKFLGFMNTTMSPALHFSADVYSAIKKLGFQDKKNVNSNQVDGEEAEEEYDAEMEYSSKENVGEVYWDTLLRYIFAENTSGGRDEAFLCLKRGPKVNWGYIDDFDEAIPRIFAAEASRSTSSREADSSGAAAPTAGEQPQLDAALDQGGRLRVKIFFAEDDSFIGKKGRSWMDDLWRQQKANKESVLYESTVVEGSEHDNIDNVRFGVIDQLFKTTRQLWIA